MTVPIQQPPPLETLRLPRHLYVLVVLAIMVGAAAATASVIGALVARDSNVTQQQDRQRDRDLLRSTCENTRAVTERFTTASPAPCP